MRFLPCASTLLRIRTGFPLPLPQALQCPVSFRIALDDLTGPLDEAAQLPPQSLGAIVGSLITLAHSPIPESLLEREHYPRTNVQTAVTARGPDNPVVGPDRRIETCGLTLTSTPPPAPIPP